MRLIMIGTLLLVIFQDASGELSPGLAVVLKQDEPNELAYFVATSDSCPVSTRTAENIVKGVFVRSRIKPLGGDAWMTKKIHLSVQMSCVRVSGASPIYSTEVFFSAISSGLIIRFAPNLGVLGIGSKDYHEQAIKDAVEEAVTQYLEANFDLAE